MVNCERGWRLALKFSMSRDNRIEKMVSEGGAEVDVVGKTLDARLGSIRGHVGGIGREAEERLQNIKVIADQIQENVWHTGLKIAVLAVVTVAAIYGVRSCGIRSSAG